MKEQRKQDVLSASILLKQRRDIKGGRPLLPPQYAGMAELADALDLGSVISVKKFYKWIWFNFFQIVDVMLHSV